MVTVEEGGAVVGVGIDVGTLLEAIAQTKSGLLQINAVAKLN